MRMGIVGLRSAQVVLLPLRTVAAAVASGVRVCGVCQVELLCRVLMHFIAGAPLAWQAPRCLWAARPKRRRGQCMETPYSVREAPQPS